MADPDTIASRLTRLRSFSGLSARALGERAGLAETHISAIEIGTIKSPMLATIQKIAEALGAPVAWLMLGEGKEPSEASVRRAVKPAADHSAA